MSHPHSFHVAGVAQCHIHLRFAWQAWHLWHWVARLGSFWSPVTPRHFAWQAWHNVTSTFVSRGRRGTMSHPPSFCVAGVALMALGGALAVRINSWPLHISDNTQDLYHEKNVVCIRELSCHHETSFGPRRSRIYI